MKYFYLIPLVILIVLSFIPFREDLRICQVYDADYKQYELWEEPMIIGLETFQSEESANVPFSLIGDKDKHCYTLKWYQSLDGLKLTRKPIYSYSFIDKLVYIMNR